MVTVVGGLGMYKMFDSVLLVHFPGALAQPQKTSPQLLEIKTQVEMN